MQWQWHSDGPPWEWYKQGVQRNSAGVTWPSLTLVSRHWCFALVSLAVCLVYGICKISADTRCRKHQGIMQVPWWQSMFHRSNTEWQITNSLNWTLSCIRRCHSSWWCSLWWSVVSKVVDMILLHARRCSSIAIAAGNRWRAHHSSNYNKTSIYLHTFNKIFTLFASLLSTWMMSTKCLWRVCPGTKQLIIFCSWTENAEFSLCGAMRYSTN